MITRIIIIISIINLLFYLIPWPYFVNYIILAFEPYLLIPIFIPLLSLITTKKLAKEEIIRQSIFPLQLPIKIKKPLIFSIILLISLFLISTILGSVTDLLYIFNNYIFVIFWIGVIAIFYYYNKNLLFYLKSIKQTNEMNEICVKSKKLFLYLILVLNIILLGFFVFFFIYTIAGIAGFVKMNI